MRLKSLNLAVNDYCNFRCAMCHIWKQPRVDAFSADEFAAAMQANQPQLYHVEELSITGGEPFLRDDIGAYVQAAIAPLPNLKRLFINTNGSRKELALSFVRDFAPQVETVYPCVSIDGDKTFHDKLRGHASYDDCVALLREVVALGYPNVHPVISTTIVSPKKAIACLEHTYSLSKTLNCDFTFRIADTSAVYYHNDDFHLPLDPTTAARIRAFILRNQLDSPFFDVLAKVIVGGRNEVMLDSRGHLRCAAGERFLFIQADGTIRPCIYSERSLGSLTDGISLEPIDDLGAFEPCPCCTECTIYPMLLEDEEPTLASAS